MSTSRLAGMRFVRVMALCGAFLAATATAAFAQTAVSGSVGSPATGTDIARLRAELDQINAEIAALKRGGRGVRDDYRLRRRMADAEALARKLTDAEAALRGRNGHPSNSTSSFVGTLEAPAVLEARADVLEDQAQRFANQAEALARTAVQLRGRQLLRRRAGQLERDPFAGVEGAKRTMVVAGTRAVVQPATGKESSGPPVPGNTTEGSGAAGGFANRGVADSQSAPGAPPMTPQGATGVVAPGVGAAGAPAPAQPGAPGLASTSGPSQSDPGAAVTAVPAQTRTATPAAAPTPGVSSSTGSSPLIMVPSQLRAFLDPATAADLRRLEAAGLAGADPATVERLVAALRARAQHLSGQARDLRQKAQAR